MKRSFPDEFFKKAFYDIVKSTYTIQFREALSNLRILDEDAYNDFMIRDFTKFCRNFVKDTTKCDIVDNNLSEAFNGSICEARTKPLINMLEDIRTY